MVPSHSGRRVLTLLRSGRPRQALVVEAFFCLIAANLRLKMRRFSAVAGELGVLVSPEEGARARNRIDVAAPDQTIRDIGWAVRAAASVAPFRSVCLQQAVAASTMLSRRSIGSTLHFGVARDGSGGLQAHAWLDAAGLQVTGYPVAGNFVEIGCFVQDLPAVPHTAHVVSSRGGS